LIKLIKQAKKGDKDSLMELLSRFKPLIKKYSNELKYEEAETDLIISFITIIKTLKIKEINYEGQAVNYIYVSLRNKKIDLFRKYVQGIQEECEINLDIVADKSIPEKEDKILIKKLLTLLTDLQRKILKAKFFMGYSENEIGKRLHISRQAVNRAKNRALNKLRKYLAS
jgi:RNA polymerase sigma factor (sigma-70 family)